MGNNKTAFNVWCSTTVVSVLTRGKEQVKLSRVRRSKKVSRARIVLKNFYLSWYNHYFLIVQINNFRARSQHRSETEVNLPDLVLRLSVGSPLLVGTKVFFSGTRTRLQLACYFFVLFYANIFQCLGIIFVGNHIITEIYKKIYVCVCVCVCLCARTHTHTRYFMILSNFLRSLQAHLSPLAN